MRRKGIFWGVFLITLGIFYLLINTNIIRDIYPFYNYWALILILAGAAIMIKNEVVSSVISGVNAFLAALVIVSFFYSPINFFHRDFVIDGDDFKTDNVLMIDKSMNITDAVLNVKSGGGHFDISQSDSNLIKVFSNKKFKYELGKKYNNNWCIIDLTLKNNKIMLPNKNDLQIQLNKNVTWNINFDCGAAKTKLDLSDFKIRELNIDMGATALDLKLGDLYDDTKVHIGSGVSSINIKLPKDVGCEITDDVNLSSKNYPGFNKIDDDHYMTDGFENTKKKIHIELKAGLSSVNIERI